jgi:cytochrome c oxidase cbb3-type subunit IV
MFKHYFDGIEYITVGPIVGLAIFFIFFIVLIYLVVNADSGFILKMKNLPLEDGTDIDKHKSTSTKD